MSTKTRVGASSASIILTIVAILVIAGAIYFTVGQNKPSSNNPPPLTEAPVSDDKATPDDNSAAAENKNPSSPQTLTITYTDDGFSPKTITINKGDTVEFVNESSGEFWPASAIHPTHEVYPEFDPKKSFAVGETYSFTFEKSGTWKYHDHLNPGQTGTIVVN